MMHVVRAEWGKLMRRGIVLGGGGALVGLAALATLVIFSQAQEKPTADQGPGFSTAVLEQRDGLVQSWGLASQLLGAASLVIFARSVSNDYARGTLKVALTQEPRRWVFLMGKFLAIAGFVGLCVFAASMVALVVGLGVGAARGLDLSAWGTAAGVGDAVLGFVRLEVAILVWGLFGFALGAVFRSAALATGIGIGVLFVGGHLLERFWDDAGKWIPSLVLGNFTVGGDAVLSLGAASLVVAAYAVALAGSSLFAFTLGDVAA